MLKIRAHGMFVVMTTDVMTTEVNTTDSVAGIFKEWVGPAAGG